MPAVQPRPAGGIIGKRVLTDRLNWVWSDPSGKRGTDCHPPIGNKEVKFYHSRRQFPQFPLPTWIHLPRKTAKKTQPGAVKPRAADQTFLSTDSIAHGLEPRAIDPVPLALGGTAARTGAGSTGTGLGGTAGSASFTGTAGEEKGAGSGEEEGDRFHRVVLVWGWLVCPGEEGRAVMTHEASGLVISFFFLTLLRFFNKR